MLVLQLYRKTRVFRLQHAAACYQDTRLSCYRAVGSTLRQLSALRSQVLRRGKRCWSAGVETRKEVLRQVLRRTLKFFAACGAKNVCGKHFLVRSKLHDSAWIASPQCETFCHEPSRRLLYPPWLAALPTPVVAGVLGLGRGGVNFGTRENNYQTKTPRS